MFFKIFSLDHQELVKKVAFKFYEDLRESILFYVRNRKNKFFPEQLLDMSCQTISWNMPLKTLGATLSLTENKIPNAWKSANISIIPNKSFRVMSKTYTHQDYEKTTPGVSDPEESENKIRFVLSELVFKV
ncbi:hypothetical protein BpHYR1_041857 [Brachionus plicatilis]|uniref:Uncharacterized protein n=1 Tax=Brachionus plicatilis TaxID=10195 RepID=A0A3M7Q3T7_BRAPC|nr:hypothetical protein BpHYR1_041857 [Brachionus plicatilis]